MYNTDKRSTLQNYSVQVERSSMVLGVCCIHVMQDTIPRNATTHIPIAPKYLTATEPRENQFKSLETIFACISVIIGCVALLLDLLQPRRAGKVARLSSEDVIYELEAGVPEVRGCSYYMVTLTNNSQACSYRGRESTFSRQGLGPQR